MRLDHLWFYLQKISQGKAIKRSTKKRASWQPPAFAHLSKNFFPGGYGGGATPVPISNTEVKPSSGDGTARVAAWESSTLPGIMIHRGFHETWNPLFLCPPQTTIPSPPGPKEHKKMSFPRSLSSTNPALDSGRGAGIHPPSPSLCSPCSPWRDALLEDSRYRGVQQEGFV